MSADPINCGRPSEAETIELKANVKSLEDKVDKLANSVDGLVEAWKTAKGITSFVKWLSGTALSVLVIWNLFKEHLK